MKKTRFTESQIIKAIKSNEAGMYGKQGKLSFLYTTTEEAAPAFIKTVNVKP